MELVETHIGQGSDPGRVRLSGTIRYDTAGLNPETWWFEVPSAHEGGLSTSGNPWLVACLPLAMKLGEPLRVSVPVDQVLLDRCHMVREMWKAWYPRLHPVPIEVATRASPDAPGQTALFFSGGVDSFYSLLRNQEPDETGHHTPIDDLLMIWGADVALAQASSFSRMLERFRPVAAAMGKRLVEIATNLRETRWGETSWARHSHGAFLASVALSLERRYRRIVVASSIPVSHRMGGWGSHPMVDPLFSTEKTLILHDTLGMNRDEKVDRVAQSELAMETLRVCWRSGSDRNCGECHKCLRTMIALELHGRLSTCRTFPVNRLDPAQVSRLHFTDHRDDRIFRRLQASAWLRGRQDVVAALDRALGRSRRLGLLIDALEAWNGPGSTAARGFLLRGLIVQ